MTERRTAVQVFYIHGGPEATDEYVEQWATDAPQQDRAHYVLYEESVEVEFDLDTGQYRYLSFAGVKLERPTSWSSI